MRPPLPLRMKTTRQSPSLAPTRGKTVHFRARLSGRDQLPDPVDTAGHGEAIFRIVGDGTRLDYRLLVFDIENAFMAHVHLARSGENGPVAVWLYPSSPPPVLTPGRVRGVLAQGLIEAVHLVGPLRGRTVSDLVEHIELGFAYVNVHTARHPPGEIRGPIWRFGGSTGAR